ncbi:hypothetical protein TRVA0_026S01442 [Trichomonascus vanleenenianus]|uniref:universal stress protein n=1 Tax=Trichomonascus vanleenenianus TaxID=2268995 RepID=UPI003ECA949E
MSVTFVEPDFSKYPQHKNFRTSPGQAPEASVDPLDASAPVDVPSRSDLAKRRGPIDASGRVSPYRRRVSFDTITSMNGTALQGGTSPPAQSFFRSSFMSSSAEYSSYTVSSTHCEHHSGTGSRTFLCSFNKKSYSVNALRWLLESMMQDGDELVCLRLHQGVDSGSPDKKYQQEAQEILRHAVELADEARRKINIVVELAAGKVKTIVYKTLVLYQPSVVIVGCSSKGYSSLKRMRYKQSISSYLVARSPVPVIIASQDIVSQRARPTDNSYLLGVIEETKECCADQGEEIQLAPSTTNNTVATSEYSSDDVFDDEDEDVDLEDDDDGDDDDDNDDIDNEDDDDEDDDDMLERKTSDDIPERKTSAENNILEKKRSPENNILEKKRSPESNILERKTSGETNLSPITSSSFKLPFRRRNSSVGSSSSASSNSSQNTRRRASLMAWIMPSKKPRSRSLGK